MQPSIKNRGLLVSLIVVGAIQLSCSGGPTDSGPPPPPAAIDHTPPAVLSTTPSAGATDFPPNTTVTVTFSEDVLPTSVSVSSFIVTAHGLAIDGTVSVAGRAATFHPTAPLVLATTYTALLTTRITDLADNTLATDYTWNFTTSVSAQPVTGLDFPGSDAVPIGKTIRFRFPAPQSHGLPIYGPAGAGVTYIWKAYPRQQSGYYTAFFWGNDNGKDFNENFLWNNGSSDTFYGAHPYPDTQPNGNTHKWEIAAQGNDFVKDTGAVVYDRWYTQALRVWSDTTGKHHEFYWDLPNTDDAHRVVVDLPPSYGEINPPVPALTWGDAPWNPSAEVWDGLLRGIQIYAAKLSLTEVLNESALPLSTALGITSVWYLNLNPTPSDISDKSGRGHDPEWVGNLRPGLYMAP